jgi:hypothetical protein
MGPNSYKPGATSSSGLAFSEIVDTKHNGNTDAGSSRLQRVTHAADKDVIDAIDLRTGNDNLSRLSIRSVGKLTEIRGG